MPAKKLISRKEYEKLVAGLPKGYCPFCDIKKQIVLGRSKHWVWIASISPYWKYHTLLVSKKHEVGLMDITNGEFSDLRKFYGRIVRHMLRLNLKIDAKKPVNQFILMIRTRKESLVKGPAYYKPSHLHIHLAPDKEGVKRFTLDSSATRIDMRKIALKRRV